MQTKLVEAAAAAGADTLLSGHGADGFLDQRPYHLADLLRRGRLWSAWRDARARGRASNVSAWVYLWRFGLLPSLPAAWRAGLGPLWRGGHAGWDQQGPGTIAPWVRPDFARTHALRERALRQLQVPGESPMLAEVRILMPPLLGDGGTRWYAAAPRGMAHGHPYLDARFISLSLGIRMRYRQEPGQQKPLLARAMRDVLPRAILERRSKGHYDAVYHSGLVRNLPVLEALVRETPVDDLGAFDRNILLHCLQQAALGFAPVAAVERLKLTLAWLCWYSRQPEWQRPMTPTALVRIRTDDRSEVSPSQSAVAAACGAAV
jgi:asparagine synthase (glutamine-hydrolysing)